MSPVEFLRQQPIRQFLERWAQCSALPISIHYINGKREGLPAFSRNTGDICRCVADLSQGRDACEQNRLKASVSSLRRRVPVPFVCHMGFACVCASALTNGTTGFVITLGPFIPLDAEKSIEQDVRSGFAALGNNGNNHALNVVLRFPPDAAAAQAEWLAEQLDHLYASHTAHPAPLTQEDVGDTVKPSNRHTRPDAARPPYDAPDIAAALTGGDTARARSIVKGVLAEGRPDINSQRARGAAIAMAVIEAAETPGNSWQPLPELFSKLETLNTSRAIVKALMAALSPLKPKRAARENKSTQVMTTLNSLIDERLIDGITLNDVAAALGMHPTAITHRLQRQFGLSYTEYLGRIRINKAKDLLRRTKLSASDIATRIGLSDASNFSKLFRKFEGMSPSQYRQRHGDDE